MAESKRKGDIVTVTFDASEVVELMSRDAMEVAKGELEPWEYVEAGVYSMPGTDSVMVQVELRLSVDYDAKRRAA